MNNNLIVILLSILAVAANATMDELRFHWSRFFGKIAKPGTKLEKWMNPSISWMNKNRFKNKLVAFLASTVFVWLTDFWHLMKLIHLNAIFTVILVLTNHAYEAKELLSGLLLLNFGWGFIFELTFGIYGGLSDLLWKKK